jgi:outer membrane immunogenic protein
MRHLARLTILFCVATALAVSAIAGPESIPSGKEMKQVASVPAGCDYSWTGFYVGINGGYGWGNADTDFDPGPTVHSFGALAPTTLNPDPDGFVGGGQIGFNWQCNKWFVLGLESDFQGSDMEGQEKVLNFPGVDGVSNGADAYIFAHERTQWFGTTRGRLGFSPLCRLLIYATGGVAYGNVDYSADTNFFNGLTYPVRFEETNVGWTAGAGAEWALNRHWSIRAEYLYYDLGDANRTQFQLVGGLPTNSIFNVHYNFDTAAHIARFGLNFKF